MQKLIQTDEITLLKDGDNYYLQYDAGMFTIMTKSLKITPEEAEAILENPDTADDIIIKYHDQHIFGDVV